MSKKRAPHLPFTAAEHAQGWQVVDANGHHVAFCDWHTEDDGKKVHAAVTHARFIALACNAHQSMQRALIEIAKVLPHNLLALLATGNDAELATALKRIIDAWNLYAAPILDASHERSKPGQSSLFND